MGSFLGEHWKYFIGAVLVHVLLAGMVALTAITTHEKVVPTLAIEAVMVNRSVLEAPARRERERLETAERQRREELQQREAERQRQEAEQQRQEAEQRAHREAEQARQAELQRQAEQRQREEAAAAERARQEEAKRVAAERQKREQAERERIAEIQRKQREAEERRRAEAERQAQAARESDLQRQLAEEEARAQAAKAGLLNQYIALLQQQFVRNWHRPPTARPGIQCKVTVTQAPGGTVLKAVVGECNGDVAVRQSIESAVYRSSPLPPPPDPRLFERTLILWFKPTD